MGAEYQLLIDKHHFDINSNQMDQLSSDLSALSFAADVDPIDLEPDNLWADHGYRELTQSQDAFTAVMGVPKSERKAKFMELMAAAGKSVSRYDKKDEVDQTDDVDADVSKDKDATKDTNEAQAKDADDGLPPNHWADMVYKELDGDNEAYKAVAALPRSEQQAKYKELIAAAGKTILVDNVGADAKPNEAQAKKADDGLHENHWADKAYREMSPESYDVVMAVPKAERKAKYDELVAAKHEEHGGLHPNHWADKAHRDLDPDGSQAAYDTVLAVPGSERQAKYEALMAAAGKTTSVDDVDAEANADVGAG